MSENAQGDIHAAEPVDRRSFLSLTSTAAMAGGLTAGYGALVVMAGKFLYSGDNQELGWLFVAQASKLKTGDVVKFETPAGQKVTLTRRTENGVAEDFLALSSTCPHLGCQVHWEPQNNRFFCPCHNGVFAANGQATAGPPADARQTLPHYPVKVENDLVFIEAPVRVVGTRA